jgi:predicted KAP-like P-loop ATPase
LSPQSNPEWPQADRPIKHAAEDALGRSTFTDRVAKVINEVQHMEDSTVLAIVGPWGSGKSSLINLACDQLKKLDDSWNICLANVWAPPDAAALVSELFAVISDALPKDERGTKVTKLIREWAPLVVSGLSLVPGVGSTLGTAGNLAVGVANEAAALRAQRPMQQVFKDLSEKLQDLDTRVLVVLDDVDRLQPDELLTLFKAIRLVASFPGVYYLLAYDEQTVISILADTPIAGNDRGRAVAYLEKIVQVPLVLPPADRYYTEKMLTDGLSFLLDQLSTPLTEEQTLRLRDLYDALLKFSLSQPRAIGRFLRQATVYLPMLDTNELDIIDFLALTHIRSYAPTTYRLLARSKAELTATEHDGPPPSSFQNQLNECIGSECGDLYIPTRNAIDALFPALSGTREPGESDIVDPWRDTVAEREADRRVSVSEYFDRYFLLGLPVADISDNRVREALLSIARSEPGDALAEVEAKLTGLDPVLASATFQKLIRFTKADNVIEPAGLGTVVYFAIREVLNRSTDSSLTANAVSWAVAALTRINLAGTPMDTGPVSGLDDEAMRGLCSAFGQVSGRWRSSLKDAHDDVAREAGVRLLNHLRQRDAADPRFPMLPLAQHIVRSRTREECGNQIVAGINSGEFTVADLAARFIELRTDWKDRAEVVKLIHEPLISLVGAARLGELCGADAHPAEPVTDFNERDVTWPNRRKMGFAYLIKTLQDEKAVAPLPPAGVLRHDENGALQGSGPRDWLIRPALTTFPTGTPKSLLCIRAAVLFPGSATGRPQRMGADVSADARARVLKAALGAAQVTKWCREAAETYGSTQAAGWEETGDNAMTTFSLVPSGPHDRPPLQAHCSLITGPQAGSDDNARVLALDLLLEFPFPPQAIPATPPYPLGETLGIDHLSRIIRMMANSGINAALYASKELLGFIPSDGHIGLWLTSTDTFEKVIDFTQLHRVGNQVSVSEISGFSRLPAEADDLMDADAPLRGLAIHLIDELLHGTNHRGYAGLLHSLLTSV